MKFRDFAESLLGSRVKIKLVRHLLSEGSLSSERELAKLLGLSHTAVNKALKELHENNLISPMRIGNVLIWQLNKDGYAYQFLSGKFEENIKKNPLSDLKNDIELPLTISSVRKVVLFGSVAEGKEVPNSDIDLFILVEGGKREKDYVLKQAFRLASGVMNKYGNKISPNVLFVQDLKNPKHKKFLDEVSKGIVVRDRR